MPKTHSFLVGMIKQIRKRAQSHVIIHIRLRFRTSRHEVKGASVHDEPMVFEILVDGMRNGGLEFLEVVAHFVFLVG